MRACATSLLPRLERFTMISASLLICVAQPGVFRPDGGVIESGADPVRGLNLAKFVLQNIAARALQHAERPAMKPRRVLLRQNAASAGFHADHFHTRIV